MPQQMVIEGDLVRTFEVTPIAEARLQDLLPHIESRPPITIGLLPKSAVVVFWDESDPKNKRAAFLCEVTPGVRTADYNGRHYAISLPWTYFLFDFSTSGNPADGHTLWTHTNSRIFWAREQVTSMKSELGMAMVPNCDASGGICYGSTAVDANLPLGVRVDRLVDEFYRTTFTHDSGTGSPFGGSRDRNATGWANWVKETAQNPQAWMNFPEWTNGVIKMQPLERLIATRHNRFEPIQLTGTIPPLIEPMTFGRADEWLMTIGPDSIDKLEESIKAYRAGQLVEPPAEENTVARGRTRVTQRTRITPAT